MQAWEEREDNDVVARNRRIRATLYGGSLPEEVGAGWVLAWVLACWVGAEWVLGKWVLGRWVPRGCLVGAGRVLSR